MRSCRFCGTCGAAVEVAVDSMAANGGSAFGGADTNFSTDAQNFNLANQNQVPNAFGTGGAFGSNSQNQFGSSNQPNNMNQFNGANNGFGQPNEFGQPTGFGANPNFNNNNGFNNSNFQASNFNQMGHHEPVAKSKAQMALAAVNLIVSIGTIWLANILGLIFSILALIHVNSVATPADASRNTKKALAFNIVAAILNIIWIVFVTLVILELSGALGGSGGTGGGF